MRISVANVTHGLLSDDEVISAIRAINRQVNEDFKRQANTLIRGPHPKDKRRKVFHWHEMCDAVQDEKYEIDGVEVSNFVLPLYFTEKAEPGSRNDFPGTKYRLPNSRSTRSLDSFGINPGGYIGFFDPVKKEHITEFGPEAIRGNVIDDSLTQNVDPEYRRKRKNKARMARRGNCYVEMGAQIEAEPQLIATSKKQKFIMNERKISIYCATHDLEIGMDVPSLKKETRQGKGYFAHDIYAESADVDKELKESGFEEIGGVEIFPRANNDEEEKSQVDLSIDCGKDEMVMAIVEIDGVLFWHQASSKTRGASVFNIQLLVAGKQTRARRGFLSKGVKILVRFIKHKIVKEFKNLVNNQLVDYLTKVIEKKAFKKPVSAKLLQLKLLNNPNNKTIGEITEHKEKLKSGERYLLLIHGIFSSTMGAFSELLLSRWDDKLLSRIHANYSKIISFDHWTVAKTTLENAEELLAMLPDNCEIDIVCHSRGAGVTRCLLEHEKIAPKLVQQQIKVGKVIFVAGACQGSPLASSDRIGLLVNVFSVLNSVANKFFPLPLVTGLLKAVQYGVNKFPGIHSMSPEAEIFKELNKPLNQLDCEYIYTRSSYEPSGALLNMFDNIGLDKFVFHGEPNDGVVPFMGAGFFDDQVTNSIRVSPGPEYGVLQSEHVFHTAFFEQKEVRHLLIDELGKK